MTPPPLPRFIPPSESGKLNFLGIFKNNFTLHGPLCDIPQPEVERLIAQISHYLWYSQEFLPQVDIFNNELKSYKNQLAQGTGTAPLTFPVPPAPLADLAPGMPGLFDTLVAVVARMKVSPKYDPEYTGKALGIVASRPVRPDHPSPDFAMELSQVGGQMRVLIKFKKYGHPAVTIESRRIGEAWVQLGINNKSPHIDDRPLQTPGVPEIREYRLCWWNQGAPHGEWSPVQSITIPA